MKLKIKTTTTSRHAGFTLIELLVVMVIVGILAAISVPDFRQYQMREQLRESVTQTKALLADAFAQARAQSQDQYVEIFPDQNQLQFCSVPQDAAVEATCKVYDLPSGIVLTVEPETVVGWDYRAPHGDIDNLEGDAVLIFTHDAGATKSLKIHALSGLVEEL